MLFWFVKSIKSIYKIISFLTILTSGFKTEVFQSCCLYDLSGNQYLKIWTINSVVFYALYLSPCHKGIIKVGNLPCFIFQALSGLNPPDLDEIRVTIRTRPASGYVVKVPVQNYENLIILKSARLAFWSRHFLKKVKKWQDQNPRRALFEKKSKSDGIKMTILKDFFFQI